MWYFTIFLYFSRRAELSSLAEKDNPSTCTHINLAMSDDEDFMGDGSLSEINMDVEDADCIANGNDDVVQPSSIAAFIPSKFSTCGAEEQTLVKDCESKAKDSDQ